MGARLPFTDKEAVQAGKPLPFSIFGADGKLLLAQGQLVASERLCESLRETGVSISRGATFDAQAAATLKEDEEKACPITRLSREYVKQNRRSIAGLKMSRTDTDEGYTTWVIGMNQRKSLILTQPMRSDKSLVPVLENDMWTFRTFHATSVFRFSASILKVSFEPFPHLHIDLPKLVDKKAVRKSPRAMIALLTTVKIGEKESKCFIADLSSQGARVALPSDAVIAKGDTIPMQFTLRVMDREYPLSLNAKVMSLYGQSDPQHPQVSFYGIFFENLPERELLILHGCVHERLSSELDSLWQALSIPS
ncbi:MAG TPA: flagellar brake protein [Burkholderiales bacterium]|nr:flagellar brake protein [Burkholderiales bacterium]